MSFDHAFCVPAFGPSPWLAACLASLLSQDEPGSRVVVTTSTPHDELHALTKHLGVPLIVSNQPPGIASDWNFALTATDARYVTVAHQDDTYSPSFRAQTRSAFMREPAAILAFTRYREHAPAGPRPPNLNMRVKSVLSELAFVGGDVIHGRMAKRRLLALGNPVCCPSATFDRGQVPDFRFSDGFRTNLDWDAWTRMADMPGAFLYIREALVSKGIHADSETSATIASRVREHEDLQMLERFWPRTIATLLMTAYRHSYTANRS